MSKLLDTKENKRIESKARQLAGVKEKATKKDIETLEKFKNRCNQQSLSSIGQTFKVHEFNEDKEINNNK